MSGRKRKKKSRHSRAGRAIRVTLAILLILILAMVFLAPPPEETRSEGGRLPANLELPAPVPGEQQVVHTGYTLSYNEEAEQPSWVAYELTREEVRGNLGRSDAFRPDPQILTGSATLDDYRGSGFDRGHLCPAADQKWSKEAMKDSFYLSNMSPQAGAFNRGIWSSLEAMVRTFANDNGSVFVATGPVLTDGPYKTIGKNKVAVPKRYYKAILFYDGERAKAIGFLLPNEGSDAPVKSYAVTIDEVEAATGLDFFPALPDETEERVEATIEEGKWNWKEYRAGDEAESPAVKSDGKKSRDSVREVILILCRRVRNEILAWLKSL